MKQVIRKVFAAALAAVMIAGSSAVTAFAANGPLPADPDNPPAWGFAMVSVNDGSGSGDKYVYSAGEVNNDAVGGVSYNADNNTLTLNNVKIPGGTLNVHMMGDDFKLNVSGIVSELGCIYVNDYEYSTSLTITGTGTLLLNKNLDRDYAISFFGGSDKKSLTIDSSVTVKMFAPESSGAVFNAGYVTNPDKDAVFFANGKPVEGVTGGEIVRQESNQLPVAFRNYSDIEKHYRGYKVISKEDPDGLYSAYSYLSDPDSVFVTRYAYFDFFDVYDIDYTYIDKNSNNKKLSKEDFDEQFDYAVNESGSKVALYTEGSIFKGNADVYTDENGAKYVADYNNNIYSVDEDTQVSFGGEPLYYCTHVEGAKPSDYNDTKKEVHTGNYNYQLKQTSYTNHPQEPIIDPLDGTTGDCFWTLDSDGTLTISGNGAMGDYDWDDPAPWQDNDVKEVVVESGVTKIGSHAFYQCGSITDVSLPDSVTEISDYAFVYIGISEIDLPDSVTTIGKNAFTGCGNLESVTIPKGVTKIPEAAFTECPKLASVTIPDSVTEIESRAFDHCAGLKSVSIPGSVTKIGGNAFGYYQDPDDNWKTKKVDGFTIYGTKGTAAETYADENGFIFVADSEVLVGDVNDDGSVNGADAGLLSRYAAGWKDYDKKIKNMQAADVNGDGSVNGADAGILARYTSGWRNYDKYFN